MNNYVCEDVKLALKDLEDRLNKDYSESYKLEDTLYKEGKLDGLAQALYELAQVQIDWQTEENLEDMERRLNDGK